MRILHVWDQAGVACVLAKYQRKAGHEVKVIKTQNDDPFGFLKFYGDKYVASMYDGIRDAGTFDVYHLHSYRFVAQMIKEINPKAKIILEYHGTDARETPQQDRLRDESFCDLMLISTPDLIEWVPNGMWLPLPIDTEHFKLSNHKGTGNIQANALFMKSNAYKRPSGGDLEYMKVTYKDPQPYSMLPETFKDYDLYIDIQDHKENKRPIEAHSKTALEALATGMSVYTWDGKVIRGLPNWYRPENVIKRLDYFYSLA